MHPSVAQVFGSVAAGVGIDLSMLLPGVVFLREYVFAREGLGCLIMAYPIAAVPAFLGGALGRAARLRRVSD